MTIPFSYPSSGSLSEKVKRLLVQQKESWPLLRRNDAALGRMASRSFSFGEFQVIARFNPERIRSSAAKTDEESVRKRACFLCSHNRPNEQQGIDFNGKYTILINPFPIFHEHLTVPLNGHLPQEIRPYFPDMLELGRQLPDFTIFYNGPRCGASAPDHLHFQAGTGKVMPTDLELDRITALHGELLFQDRQIIIHAVGQAYLRKFIVLWSASADELTRRFGQIMEILEERGQEGEPMVNILSAYRDGYWHVILFPRDLQRPRQFFEEGGRRLIISPASVELGGLAILPRKEDFEKLTKADLADIYSQVTMNERDFKWVRKKIQQL